MTHKLHGIRTGTIQAFTDSGERVHWVPSGDLTLVEAGSCDLPNKIAANPTGAQGYREFTAKAKSPIKEGARILVGFNVGGEDVWRSGEVYLAAYLLRDDQARGRKVAPAFTMFVGIGAYPGETLVSSERSAQIVFMNFSQDRKAFFKDMFSLAGQLAEVLAQESVLLELQEDGGVVYLDYIESKKKRRAHIDETKEWLSVNKDCIAPKVWRMR